MISSDQRPPGQDWLVRRVVDLERQVRELLAGRRLEAATIGAGGIDITGGSIRIRDDTGQIVTQIGLLPDGSYSVQAINSAGQTVDLAALAFGPRSETVTQVESTSSVIFGDLTTVGPTLADVAIGPTGRALVIVGAFIEGEAPTGLSIATGGGRMGYDVSGATSIAPGSLRAATFEAGYKYPPGNSPFAITVRGSVSRVSLLDQLNPGLHTFTAKYRTGDDGLATTFSFRTLTVMPF